MKRQQTNDPPVAAAAPLDHHPPCHPLLAAKNVSTPQGGERSRGRGCGWPPPGPPHAPHWPARRLHPPLPRPPPLGCACCHSSERAQDPDHGKQARPAAKGRQPPAGGGQEAAPRSDVGVTGPRSQPAPQPPSCLAPPPRCGAGVTPHRQGGGEGRSMPPSSAAAGPQKNNRPRGLGMGGLVAATCLFPHRTPPSAPAPTDRAWRAWCPERGGRGWWLGGGGKGRKKVENRVRVEFSFTRVWQGLIFFLTPRRRGLCSWVSRPHGSLLQPELTAPQ